jgi:hypothetical protein
MDKLKFINEQMTAIGVPYEFGQWSSEITYPYWVGEITEEPITTEDGLEPSTMLLTGFHRGEMIDLLAVMEKIKSHFSPVHGLRDQTDSGSSIAVFFDGYFSIPSGEIGLEKMQIMLKIKEWKGDW